VLPEYEKNSLNGFLPDQNEQFIFSNLSHAKIQEHVKQAALTKSQANPYQIIYDYISDELKSLEVKHLAFRHNNFRPSRTPMPARLSTSCSGTRRLPNLRSCRTISRT